MESSNAKWSNIVQRAAVDMKVFHDESEVKKMVDILKCNVRACTSIGTTFINQLSVIYMDMLKVYQALSEQVVQAIGTHGEVVTSQPLVKSMRAVKKEVRVIYNI